MDSGLLVQASEAGASLVGGSGTWYSRTMTSMGRTVRTNAWGGRRPSLVLFACLWLALWIAACGRSKEARGETSDSVAGASAQGRAASRFNEAAYELSMRPVGAYRTGQPGVAEVVLVAKDPYHVNPEFPLMLRLRESTGVKYARTIVAKDRAKVEVKRATVPVEFTPEASGSRVLAGSLRFSVCNDQRCLVEKRELELGIEVR
jgi:hypothetical protein